jgi:hypothetical protein
MDVHVMDDGVLDHVTSAAVVVYGLQMLKRTGWYANFAQALPIDDAHVHRFVSAIGALLSGVGIHWAATGNADAGWHLAITIPPLMLLLHAVWDWASQFALQQIAYDLVAQKAGVTKPIELTLPSSLPSVRLPVVLLAAVLGAGVLTSSCSSNKLVNAVNAEHVAVTAVHAVVQAEAQAFRAGAYDNAHHQTYVAALLKVVEAEKALNDALTGWNAASGQPMPAHVTIAIGSLASILSDVTPLIPQHSTIASLATSATAAIQALAGGK